MRRRLWVGLLALPLVTVACAVGQLPATGDDDAGLATVTDSTPSAPDAGSVSPGCSAIQCDPNATCTDGPTGPTCACNAGFTGDGRTCADTDECASGSAMCDPNATCKNTVGSYACTCSSGYTGNGKTCTDVNECQNGAAKCDPTSECKNVPGGYACVCKPGYALKGATCVEIDECTPPGVNDCAPSATCTNTPGSFTCTCPTGYAGDGKVCTDIDECTPPGVNNCDPNATCTNTPGSFTCACKMGYEGNGLTCSAVGLGATGIVSINGGDASAMSTAVTLYLQEPSNLLTNPGAETANMAGWTILANGAGGWGTGSGDPAIQLFGTLHFLTSYAWCTRSQLLDLTALGFTQADLDLAPPITVREWYRGGGYNTADKYYVKVELRDAMSAVVASYNLGTSSSPTTTNNTWQMATQTFSGFGAGVRYVYFEDGGRDAENWVGRYGAAMDGASVVVGGGFQMRFSNDNITWSAWQPFAPTAPWTLDAMPGTKVVYVQFQTPTTTWPAVSDTITLP